MIGLTFLAIGLLWLAFSVFVGRKLPRWLGIRNPAGQWAVTVAVVAVLLVGPFVDHIVGMRQFQKLCDERTAIHVSPDANLVRRATDITSDELPISGYVINIKMSTRTYIDLDTKKPFLSYEIFRTSGGRVASLALLGGWHSCSAERVENKNHQQFAAMNAYELLRNGRKK